MSDNIAEHAPITEAKATEYVRKCGAFCPYCDETDITGGSVDIEGAGAYQQVTCNSCQGTWTDCYMLHAVMDDMNGSEVIEAET